jgi:beta-glucosidase
LRHESLLKRKAQGPIDLLFLGDSITEDWLDAGKSIWKQRYLPRNAADFGIGGDETQHVLWRIENGAVDGLNPKVIVLLIGTNNLGNGGYDGQATTEGIQCIVQSLRERLPASQILLLAVFPRDPQPGTRFRQEIEKINQSLRRLDDGRLLRFLDINEQFLQPDGRISPAIMPDSLHLSTEAYRLWADAMEPMLREMLGEKFE